MKLSEIDRAERARTRVLTARHEAGHAVAAVMFGARIDVVELLDDTDRRGKCTYIGDLTAAADAAVAYAGPWVAARSLYGPMPSHREIRSVLDGTCDHESLIASGVPLPRDVEPLLETCWPAIRAVTQHLIRHDRADHAVVCAALGIPEVDGHLSAEASAIRAGLAPTPQKLPGGSPHSPATR